MKKSIFKRFVALCLFLSMTLCFVPVYHAETGAVFTVVSSVEGESVSVGDTVTFTVGVNDCPGIVAGTVIFSVSPSLTYISSTLYGESIEAELIQDGEYAGSYGIMILDPNTDKIGNIVDFISVTFTVTGLENVSFSFAPFECITAPDTPLVYSVPQAVSYKVNTPDKPNITTTVLPKAVYGRQYSFFLLSDFDNQYVSWDKSGLSDLPEGLSLLDDGEITGMPTIFGTFTFSVTACVLDSVISDPYELTLEILEKPQELNLKQGSSLTVDKDDLLLSGLRDKTTVSNILSQFEDDGYTAVFDANGNRLGDDDYVGTGCTVALLDGDDKVYTLSVVLMGDVDGDGLITSIDYLRIKMYYNGDFDLDGVNLAAAKVAGEDYVSSVDYLRVKKYYNGEYELYE